MLLAGLVVIGSQNLLAQDIRGLQLSVIPDKQTYVVGENVGFTIFVENTGTSPVTVSFPTVCWFDYWIDFDFQYLDGMMCSPMYFEFDLLPGQSFQESFVHNPSQYSLSAGQHYITGILNGNPYASGSTTIAVTEPTIQVIDLTAGWNLISPLVTPVVTTTAVVFSPSNMTCTLEMVTGFQNQQGVFYDPNGPTYLNTLTNITSGEGYWLKVENSGTLTLSGTPFPEDFTVNLLSGWNLIGYWLDETTTPEAAFAPLINAGILEMVTGYDEGGKFFDPDGPPFLNTLNIIKHGSGYWVKVSDDYPNFSYPDIEWQCGDLLPDIRDGQTYATVQIGEQCWMAENLNVGSRTNGNQNQTNNGIIEKYCYNDLQSNCDIYGGLYQWSEMMEYTTIPGVRGICPVGWHLPSDYEWCTLEQAVDSTITCEDTGYRGIDGGGKLKEEGNAHWYGPNTGATNISGFTALPGGFRNEAAGFYSYRYVACFWSSTQSETAKAWRRGLINDNAQVLRNTNWKAAGFSVRCLKDETSPPTTHNLNLEVIPTGAGTVTGAGQYQAGEQINITAEANPGWEFVNWTDDDGIVSELPNFTFTMPTEDITLTANFVEEQTSFICGDQISDVDGNVYNTVLIGNQCWMAENLKTTTYLNGTPIEYPGSNNSAWTNNTSGAYAWYNNDTNYKESYGALYNWYAVTNGNGLCPEGWHVPSVADWSQLTNFIGGTSSPNGNKLKSCRQVNSPLGGDCNTSEHPRWNSHSTYYGFDAFGFSAFGGGARYQGGSFNNLGSYGDFWTSNQSSSTSAHVRSVYEHRGDVWSSIYPKTGGFSVRCIKDN